MSSIDFSSCPEFQKVVQSLGGVKEALNFLIETTNGSIDELKDDSAGKEGDLFRQYFENISRYYSLSKKTLDQSQQADFESKIQELSGRVSVLTGNAGSAANSGLWPYLSYLNPFSYSYFNTNKAASIIEVEATQATQEISSTPEPSVFSTKLSTEIEDHSTVCWSKDTSSLAADIRGQLETTQAALEELQSSFREIESGLLSTKDFNALEEQITTVSQNLNTYQESLDSVRALFVNLPVDEEIQQQINIFDLSLSQFRSYIDSLRVAIQLQGPDDSTSKALTLSDAKKEVSAQIKGSGSLLSYLRQGIFGRTGGSSEKAASKGHDLVRGAFPAAAHGRRGISCAVGLPNLGVTCYVNTFLKTCLPYFDLLKNKQLTKGSHESTSDWRCRNQLRETLIELADELRSADPNSERIQTLLKAFVDNPLLDLEIPKRKRFFGTTFYHMGDSRGLATLVFDLLEIKNDPSISIVRGSILQEIGGTARRSGFLDEASETSIRISGGTTIQQMIDNYSTPEELLPENRWAPEGYPVASCKRDLLVADHKKLPGRLIFTITQPAVYKGNTPPLEDIEDVVLVPIHDRNGILLGKMKMQLEAVASNSPNAHFLGYVREADGSWTEHNDSIITPGLTKDQMFDQTGMRASVFGCQFNYVTTGFIPA